jgi:hypothetical protein
VLDRFMMYSSPGSKPDVRRHQRTAGTVILVALGVTGLLVFGSVSVPSGEISSVALDLEPTLAHAAEHAESDPVAPMDEEAPPVPVVPGAASARAPVDLGPCVLQPPLSEVELAEILQQGYLAFFGHEPSANRLACAWAHCAFEHARGTKVFGNNLGHLTTTGVWRGPTCQKSFTNRVATNPDRWELTTQTFRVHDDLQAGALDYWKLMNLQYPGVMIACDRGDSLAAARELRRRHYFTGPEERYVQSLAQLYLEGLGNVLPKMQKPPWPIGPKPGAR